MLSREQAISECKALWEEIYASGKSKRDFSWSEEGEVNQ